MADSSSHDVRAEGADRSAKIEELLLAGLDHYFAGEHERAISVWTRVLFIDRGHARARAYIERARGALAERQRESEALVEQGVAAFDQGEATTARELLSSAVERGGPNDVALAVLDRLSRLDQQNRLGSEGPAITDGDRQALTRRAPAGPQRPRAWLAALLLVLALVCVAIGVALSFPDLIAPTRARPGRRPPAAAPAQELLPLPRSADLALGRARSLSAAGHLKDALAALEAIRPGDPAHPDAVRLRAEIQASLLAGLPPLGTAK
jgi:hypothetical protein